MIERAPARELVGASAGGIALLSEDAHAEGVYHAICRGYKAEHEKEYLQEFEHLQRMRQQRDHLMRFVPAFAEDFVARLKWLKDLEAFERYMDSLTEVKWEERFRNTVMTVGKNLALDTFLAGSAYTVTGPYMGLIGSGSYSAISAADTMASHAGWQECGNANAPTYSGNRKTVSWNAASSGSKAPSSAPVFSITGTGTVKGAFLLFGSGASATVDNTSGTLWSAGLFSGGDQAVANTNTLTVTYSTSL